MAAARGEKMREDRFQISYARFAVFLDSQKASLKAIIISPLITLG